MVRRNVTRPSFAGMVLCCLALGATVEASAVEVPITGRKLVVKTEPATSKRRFLFKTVKDAALSPGVDLSAVGATIYVAAISCDGGTGVCSPDAITAEIYLEPDRWSALGDPPGSKGYRYRDKSGAAAGVRLVVYKEGKLVIKAIGPNWPWTPSGDHDKVVVYFHEVGGDAICADLGLGTEVRNEAGHLSFRNAPAPAACQFSCGNQVREPWEDCDGDDPGFSCKADCSVCCVGSGCSLLPCCADETFPCGPCLELGGHCERTALWEFACCEGLVCAPTELQSFGVGGDCCLPAGSPCDTEADCCGGAAGSFACANSQCCVKTGEVCRVSQFFEESDCCSPADICAPLPEFPNDAGWCCTTTGGACTTGDTCCSGTCTANACE